jgi:tricorn protease-like protein
MRSLLVTFSLYCCSLAIHAAELKPIGTLRLPCESPYQSVSPSGEQIAVRCTDHSIRLVSIATGREQHAFPSDDDVTDYSFSRDGRWFAVGLRDGSAEIVLTSGSGEPKRWKATTRGVSAIAFLADDDSILIAGNDEPGQIWDVSGIPKVRATLHSDFGGLTASAISSDGKQLATAEGDTVLRVYDTSTWKVEREYPDLKLETFAVAFTVDGKFLLAGGVVDYISLIDLSSGHETRRLGGEVGSVIEIMPLGDNQRAVAMYFNEDTLKRHWAVWNLETLKTEPLTLERPLTGGGIVRGKRWFASAAGSSLQIWEYQ